MLLLRPGPVLSVPFVQTVTVLPCECSTETKPRQVCPHRHSPAPPGTSGLSLDQHRQPASPVTSKFVPNIENQSWLDLNSSFCFQQHAVAHRRAWTGEAQKATEKRNFSFLKGNLSRGSAPNTALFLFLVPRNYHTGCCSWWTPVPIPCLCCFSEHQQQPRSRSHRHSLHQHPVNSA